VTAPEPYCWPLRVYWEDTDGGGVVYYANYLRFMERARTEWLRGLGYSQAALAADPGILFMVLNVNVDYRSPARLDDALVVTCEPRREGRASMRFTQRIHRGELSGPLLVEASVRVACVDARTYRPKRLPEFIPFDHEGAGDLK
jgi:tol-pal system-associated acyl-CoA thioesterase